MRSLEECAAVVLRKWPQNDPCERCGGTGITEVGTSGGWGEIPCPAHRNPIPITPAELLADDDGLLGKWLWALWLRHGFDLHNPRPHSPDFVAMVGEAGRYVGDGDTATEAITRALCALAEAS